MKADTIIFKLPHSNFHEVVSRLESIFKKPVTITRQQGVQIKYNSTSVKYVSLMAQINLGEYGYCDVKKYKGRSSIFIEIHGLHQYAKDGSQIHLDIDKELKVIIETMYPTLWRVDMPLDIALSFFNVAPYFNSYQQPYSTSYYSHKKESKVQNKFNLYCKTTKNKLDIELTRLELKKDYSRKNTPIVLTTFGQFKKILAELSVVVKDEFEKHFPNVYIPYTYKLDTNTNMEEFSLLIYKGIPIIYTPIERIIVSEINISEDIEEIQTIEQQGDVIIIHTSKGSLYYRNNELYYPKQTKQIVKILLTRPPTSTECKRRIDKYLFDSS